MGLCASAANFVAMKYPEHLGDLVREWRTASNLSLTKMAKLIADKMGKDFNYQNLQHLEKPTGAPINRPYYLHELAEVMGTTTGDLLALRMPPPLGADGLPAPGSPDEPEGHPPNLETVEFSRNDFLRAYDNLTPAQTQLLARLMVAVGFVPGLTVEVYPSWRKDYKEGSEPTHMSDGLPSAPPSHKPRRVR